MYQALFISRQHNLSFCPIQNAAADWMSKRLLALSGNFNEFQLARLQQPASLLARHHFPYLPNWNHYPKVLNHSLNMIVVRHPFNRLLHYYKNNLENSIKNPTGYNLYGRKIAATYRNNDVIRREPTFAEFVRYLLDLDGGRKMDEAWKPLIVKCSPCQINYNAIIHYDTLWRDFNYVWQKMNITIETTALPPEEFNSHAMEDYFSQLTEEEMKQLQLKYAADFAMFGFNIKDHLTYACTSTTGTNNNATEKMKY